MSWMWISALLVGLLWGAGVSAARAEDGAAAGQRLRAVIDAFVEQSTPDQQRHLGGALRASPALVQQLDSAAEAGRLTAIEVLPPHRRTGPDLAAAVDGGRIVLAADFLTRPAKQRRHEVIYKDDILPNNLVFVLGSLAFHLQSEPPSPSLEQDARACIQGWNDVMDAAERENGNKSLTPQQHAMLLLNLRYRMVFIGGSKDNKVKWSPSGTLEPSDQNVAAIVEALKAARLVDFGVAPR